MKSVVVTVVGPNRTGIINEMSEAAVAFDANWLESQLANLSGQFAGIVRLEVSESNHDALIAAFHRLEVSGLKVVVTTASEQDAPATRELTLEILGLDHPGIVRDISTVLNENQISIEEMESTTLSGSMSGEILFKARARLSVPVSLATETLNDRLQDIADDIMVDIILEQ